MNIDISLNIYIVNLKCSMSIIKVFLGGRVSQILYLGPSFDFMEKKGELFVILFNANFYNSLNDNKGLNRNLET